MGHIDFFDRSSPMTNVPTAERSSRHSRMVHSPPSECHGARSVIAWRWYVFTIRNGIETKSSSPLGAPAAVPALGATGPSRRGRHPVNRRASAATSAIRVMRLQESINSVRSHTPMRGRTRVSSLKRGTGVRRTVRRGQSALVFQWSDRRPRLSRDAVDKKTACRA